MKLQTYNKAKETFRRRFDNPIRKGQPYLSYPFPNILLPYILIIVP